MSKTLPGASLCMGLSSAFAVHAQTSAHPRGTASTHGMRHQDDKRVFTKPSERIEARLAYRRTALRSRMRTSAVERVRRNAAHHARARTIACRNYARSASGVPRA